MRCESSGWFASISNGLTGFVTVQRASVTRCPASGGAPFLTGRFRHSISGRMIFAGATRSAKVGVSAPLRAIPGKLVTQVPPGVSSRRWRRICFARPTSGQRYIAPPCSRVFQGRRRRRIARRHLLLPREPCSRSVFPSLRRWISDKSPKRVSRTITRRTGAPRKGRTNLSWSSSRRFSSKAASNPSYPRLRMRPSTFRKHNSYQRIGGNKLSACLAPSDRTLKGRWRMKEPRIVWSLSLPKPDSRARQN